MTNKIKYLFWLVVFACTFCACNMGKFYAGKRIGHSHKKSVAIESSTVPSNPDSVIVPTPVPYPVPENQIAVITDVPITRSIPHAVSKKHSPADPLKKIKVNLPLSTTPLKHAIATGDDDWTMWLMGVLALLICILVGLVAFLVLWIFVAFMQALTIALWVAGLLFLFLAGSFIFGALFIGD